MRLPNGYWTKERCAAEAAKYRTAREFNRESNKAYQAARKKGFLAEICSHMTRIRRSNVTDEELIQLAGLYNTREGLKQVHHWAAVAISRRRLHEKAYRHMPNFKNIWHFDAVQKVAAIHETRSSFFHGERGAYKAARVNGWMEEVTAHMVPGEFGFDSTKPARLYYLQVSDRVFGTLYKIGITNRTVIERFLNPDLDKMELVKRWQYETGYQALQRETKIKRVFSRHRYEGEKILMSGFTELFKKDILGLDPESGVPRHSIVEEILKEAKEIPANLDD
jgi:hypothetical protein